MIQYQILCSDSRSWVLTGIVCPSKEIPFTVLPNLRIVLRHGIHLQERALLEEEIDIKDVTVFASRRDSI